MEKEKVFVPTIDCYDAWSATYDSDGNVLQLLDDVAFDEVVRPLLNVRSDGDSRGVVCELGCGTGRNTKKLIEANWSVVSEGRNCS